jgi:general secretion pathway protein H
MTPGAVPRSRGFTLIELMVVMVIVGLSAALVSLNLPDPRPSRLEREADRLCALLESGRALSRASGQVVTWWPRAGQGDGAFEFVGVPASAELPRQWLNAGVVAEVPSSPALLLGPEPILPAQTVVLRLDELRLTIASDGLQPFRIRSEAAEGSGKQP